MNKILLALPPPALQYSANLISFYFQHVRPRQVMVRKHLRRLILLVLLLNLKSLPGVFHAKMGLRIAAVQLYSLSHRKGFRIKPTDTSVVRERVWVDDLDLNFHFSNSSYGKNCDYARVKYVTSLFGSSVLPLHPLRKIAFVLGGNQFLFKKEITLFQSFEIRTRLLAWNQKWFVIEHRMYTPSRKTEGAGEQTLCAIGISKFVLKHAGGSWKNKTIPFLDALEMVGHDVKELRVLEAKSDGGNVVLLPKEELEFRSFDGWTHRGAAVGNALELCEHMLAQE
ncbi:hypothetical protein BC939DRAFT_508424 [Gamsiella multidivaricata]|uniref:uncharacterized protein n=1 Tax=Gamsiella multidivaricata TaxID=101098 RepID=UPI00221F5F09|nr:uncharacterized protein BC939DRAFT_508424 [Gamsiella multidivaricata]KAG0365079.1 hypothetical protein BGZ54_006884 [Gamsiella multidivaricata]KAI7816303.1 hypothetical protein BC939DRAFT_508424 [Gamsiella multidivaricata]